MSHLFAAVLLLSSPGCPHEESKCLTPTEYVEVHLSTRIPLYGVATSVEESWFASDASFACDPHLTLTWWAPGTDSRTYGVHCAARFSHLGEGKDHKSLKNWLAGVGEDANYEFSISVLPTTPELPKMRKRDRDRAEALRLAGGPKPSLRDRAVALATERGVVRTRDLTDIGVPRCYLARMCEEGLLIKVGYGQYRAADRQAA